MSSPTNAQAIRAALAKPNYLPPGTTLALMEQSRDESAVVAILFVGSLVSVVVALRCYARVAIVKKFGLDDWLALLTLAPYAAFIALCLVLIHLGSGRHFVYIQYVLDNATINMTEVLDFAAHIIYTTALVICRLSGLAFYARISYQHTKFTWSIRGAAIFILTAYLPQLFLIVFHCLPVTGYWPYAFQTEVSNYTCLEWGTVYVTNSAISLVCDMILFAIPIAIISRLQCSTPRKIGLSFVLMPGLLVIGVSCTRMYLVIVGQWEADESWSYDPLLAIEVSEIGSTLIALSIPALKPICGSVFRSISDSLEHFFGSWATYGRSKFGTLGASDHGGSRTAELRPTYSSTESQINIKANTKHSPIMTGWIGQKAAEEGANGYESEAMQYSAAAFHISQGRDPSVGSDVSQEPTIRYKVKYSVPYVSRAGTVTGAPRL